jgi:hypothetical protein
MSDEAAAQRTAVIWSAEARANLRAIDRETAMQILHCLDRYLASRTGDVKKLKTSYYDGFSAALRRLPGVFRPERRKHYRDSRRS